MPKDTAPPAVRKRTRAPGAPARVQGQGGSRKGGGSGPYVAKDNLSSFHVIRLLEAICEGPVKSISPPYFDGTPLIGANDRPNFEGVTYRTRMGLPDQAPIPGFPSQESETGIDAQVVNGTPVVRRINDPDTDSFKVQVKIPALYRREDSGDIRGVNLSYRIQYRSEGNANWIDIPGSPFRLSDKKATSANYLVHKADLTGPAPWDVRVVRVSPDSPDPTKVANDLYFYSLTQCIDQKMIYPHTAMAGITAYAEQFGSSLPTRGYLVEGLICRVPSNFDPVTRTYSGVWNGTFKQEWTDCPAWCLREMIRHMRWGLGQYVPVDALTDTTLYAISQYCAQHVDDGKGGTEPRFTFNAYIHTLFDAYELLNAMVSVFRGMIYYSMGQVFFTTDGPRDPELTVTRANTVNGEFTYRGADILQQHNRVNVTYNDPNNGYRREIVSVEDPESIRLHGLRTSDIVAFGCTSRSQALRAGRWLLYTERMESETVSYVGGPDHVDIAPGAIVRIMDPSQMGVAMGGRLAGYGTATVTLDREVVLEPGETYELSVVDRNRVLHYRRVTSAPGARTVVGVNTALPDLPANPVEVIWALRKTSGPDTLWRVLSNSEVGPDQYDITAVRHEPSKFNIIENGLDIPQFPEPLLPTGPLPQPLNLRIRSYLSPNAGSGDTVNATVSVTRPSDPRVRGIELAYREGDKAWRSVDLRTDTSTELTSLVSGGIYWFRARTYDGTGRTSEWTAAQIEEMTGDPVDADVPNVSNVTIISGFRTITVRWTNPPISNFRTVEVWGGPTANYNNATLLTRTTTERHAITGLSSGQTLHLWTIVRVHGAEERSPALYLGYGTTTRLEQDDVGPTIIDQITDIAEEVGERVGFETVSTLPSTGRPDQIVFLVPPGQFYRWDATANNGAGGWTEGVYAGIPDGYLDETKFAQGIEPVRIYDSGPLPTVRSTSNIVWNGALYTWNGTEYTTPSFSLTPGIVQTIHIANLAATAAKIANEAITAIKLAENSVTRNKILDGAVGALQLADLAVTNAKIAGMEASKVTGQIGSTQIANDAITTPKLAAGSVVAGKVAAGAIETDALAAGSVVAGKLAAESVTTNALATNAITARTIAAEAVGVDQLAARAVVASKMAIGNFTNLVLNSDLSTPDGWTLQNGAFHVNPASNSTAPGNIRIEPGLASNTFAYWGEQPSRIPVVPGEEYSIGAGFRGFGATSQFTPRIAAQFWDAAGGGAGNDAGNLAPVTVSVFHIRERSITVPPNAAYMRIGFGRAGGADGPDAGWGYIEHPFIRRKNGGELIIDGSLTAANIAANAITTDKLAANSVTADILAANSVTTNALAANSVTANTIAANAVTAAKVAAGAINTRELAAGAVVASRMAITAFSNLVLNSNLETDDGWVLPSGVTHNNGTPAGSSSPGQFVFPAGLTGQLRANWGPGLPGGFIEVEPNTEYIYGASFGVSNAGGRYFTPHLLINFFDRESNVVGSDAGTGPANTTVNFVDYNRSVVSPPNAAYARVQFGRNYNTGLETHTGWVEKPYMRRKNGGELLVDGIITAQKVMTGAIGTDALAANAITASKIAAGAIVTSHLAAGAVTADKITTQTVRALLGQFNSLTAANLTVGVAELTTPLLAPNAITRMVSVSRSFYVQPGYGFQDNAAVGKWVNQRPPDSLGGVPENRNDYYDYLTATISAPHPYDLYFWISVTGGDVVANIFRNDAVNAYNSHHHRAILDSHTYSSFNSGAIVGRIPSVSGQQRLTVSYAGIHGSEWTGVANASITLMAVMK